MRGGRGVPAGFIASALHTVLLVSRGQLSTTLSTLSGYCLYLEPQWQGGVYIGMSKHKGCDERQNGQSKLNNQIEPNATYFGTFSCIAFQA
eukprot:5254302-Amphidinium_carterae.1